MTLTAESPVPFGKYKGQPLAVLIADRAYCDWLLTQAGIVEKHPEVVEFVTHGEQGNATPIHNALQAKLLDPAFVSALSAVLNTEGLTLGEFEWNGFDALLSGCQTFKKVAIECKPTLSDDYPAVLRQIKTADQVAFAKATAALGMYREYTSQHRGWIKVLLVGSFSSAAVSLEQVKQFFLASGVRVVLASEVDAVGVLA